MEDPRDYLKGGIAKSEILNKDSRFIICSYFWGRNNRSKNSIRGMTYGQQADRLVENCKNLDLIIMLLSFPFLLKRKFIKLLWG